MFTHGDLHIEHVFVDDGEINGIVDWSEACPGDALFDLATITLTHEEHLDDFIAGYGADVDRDLIRAWRSWRCAAPAPLVGLLIYWCFWAVAFAVEPSVCGTDQDCAGYGFLLGFAILLVVGPVTAAFALTPIVIAALPKRVLATRRRAGPINSASL